MMRSGRNIARLEHLARGLGVTNESPLPVFQPQIYQATEQDHRKIAEALNRTRLKQSQARRHLLSKVSKSRFAAEEATDTLQDLVETECTPGQAVELLRRGADVNYTTCKNTKIWKMIQNREQKSTRSTIFETAVGRQDAALVNALVEKADNTNINKGLEIAISSRDLATVRILMSKGADPNLCVPQFRKAVRDKDHDMVKALSSGSCQLQGATATHCLCDAVRLSDPSMTQILTWLEADADVREPSALSIAVQSMDLTLVAILCMAKLHPSPSHLGSCVISVCEDLNNNSIPQSTLTLIEILLAAGAAGSEVSEALTLATQRRLHRLVQLLARYSEFSATYTPSALKSAISNGDVQLLSDLLTVGPSSEVLDDLLAQIPLTRPTTGFQDRFDMMKLLIELRPSIHVLSKALQDATEHREFDLATQLLQALLSAGADGEELGGSLLVVLNSQDESAESLRLIEMLVGGGADVNVKQSQCFALAINHRSIPTVERLLKGSPSALTLQKSFEVAMLISDLELKLILLQILLVAGAQGAIVDRTLCGAIDGTSEGTRLARLILQTGKADINISNGETIRRTVVSKDLDLLRMLMNLGPSGDNLHTALQQAVELKDKKFRFEACEIILRAGATSVALDQALRKIVESAPQDKELIKLLLSCNASIDFDAGRALCTAITLSDDALLSLLLQNSAHPETLVIVLRHLYNTNVDNDQRFRYSCILLNTGAVFPPHSLATLFHQGFDKSEDVRTLDLLLKKGASVNLDLYDALKKAIDVNNQVALRMLLDARPTKNSIRKVFEHVWTSQYESGLELMRTIIQDSRHRDMIKLDRYLVRTAHAVPCSYLLINFLLEARASIEHSDYECLHCAAARLDNELLALLLPHVKSRDNVTTIFRRLMKGSNVWQDDIGLHTVQLLLRYGAYGETLDQTLLQATEKFNSCKNASNILDCLVDSQASSDYQNGECFEVATRKGDMSLIARLFDSAPSPSTVTNAFPYIFLSSADEQSTLQLIELFLARSVDDLDLNADHKELHPILLLCMSKWPKSTAALKALLKAGASPDRTIRYLTVGDSRPEHVTALLWALYQTSPKIDDSVIMLLVECNANLNFATKHCGITPMIAAVKNTRADIVALLLGHLVQITQADRLGRTPLCYASTQDDLSILDMLLQAGAPTEDGSLHSAVFSCKRRQASLLLENGHDPNFTSILYSGQPPLEVLVRQQTHHYSSSDLKAMFELLVLKGANAKYQVDGKSLLYIALDMPNADHVVPALLSAFMGKLVNSDFNLYHSANVVYSPIAYIRQNRQASDISQAPSLLRTLSSYNCLNVWYHKIGPQPDGYTHDTAPDTIRREEEHRLQRVREETEAEERNRNDIRRQQERTQALLNNESRAHEGRMLLLRNAAAEEQRIAKLNHDQQLVHLDEMAATRDRITTAERRSELSHQRALAIHNEQSITTESRLRLEGQRQLALEQQATIDAQLNATRQENQLNIEARRQLTLEDAKAVQARVTGEQRMFEIAARGRQAQEAVDRRNQTRFLQQIAARKSLAKEQKACVNSQRQLLTAQGAAQQRLLEYKNSNELD